VIVLVPASALLLVSVAALAIFYAAPTRFNAWLSRLPGDDFLRTALIFAPATLLAVVVMALLYANDAPRREAIEATRPSRRRPVARRAPPAQRRRRPSAARWARASLWLSLPALTVVAAAHLAAFVAPERVEGFLEALPATSLLTRIFETSPLIVLAAVGLGLIFGFAPAAVEPEAEARAASPWTPTRIARLGALLILAPSVALLVMSVLGLAMVSASSERLVWLAERLPAEALLRLMLAFAPALLLGVVLLAALYLAVPRGEEPAPTAGWEEGGAGEAAATVSVVGRAAHLRSGLAVGVLAAGFGFTALAGVAVLAVLVFVLAAA